MKPTPGPGTLVAVPVWGRLDLAERCIRSLDRGTPVDVELLVVDDAGPERVSQAQLSEWVSSDRTVTLVSNDENLGFPATANRAFESAGVRDVALVNSDVEVFDGWLHALSAALASDERVASASALANDASILTVPPGPQGDEPTSEAAARLAQRLLDSPDLPVAVDVPVAVGHCVLLRGTALRDVGRFDHAFAPGYGEEVDWSMRARRQGWRHVAATRCYVLHGGGSSFSGRVRRRTLVRRQHEARLLLRYPAQVLGVRVTARRQGTQLARVLRRVTAVAANEQVVGAVVSDGAVGSDRFSAAPLKAPSGAPSEARQDTMQDTVVDADDQWLEELIVGLERGKSGVPSGPPPEVQAQFVGWSGEAALRECYPVYRLIKESLGKPVSQARILDFGVGWGRLIRFFGREASPGSLHGVDVDGDILEVCARTGVPGELRKVEPTGSLPYDDAFFDLAYAYSVFSHLAEDAARHWFSELARCVRPGGRLVLTTQGARFLQLCRAVRDKKDRSGFELTIDQFLADPHQAVQHYEQGRFVYAPTGGGGVLTADFYGWAAIPPRWIEENVAGFTVERMVDDPGVNEQVVFVLRRSDTV